MNDPSGGTEWWYRTPEGETYGPYGFDELRSYALEGRIDPGGFVREGEAGDWVVATERLPALGISIASSPAAPPTSGPRPPRPGADPGVSNVSLIAYILVGLLPLLFFAVAGIHNLIAGRTGPGLTQLLLSTLGLWGLTCVGLVTGGLGWCLMLPLWIGLFVWTLVDVVNVRTDAAGRPFAS